MTQIAIICRARFHEGDEVPLDVATKRVGAWLLANTVKARRIGDVPQVEPDGARWASQRQYLEAVRDGGDAHRTGTMRFGYHFRCHCGEDVPVREERLIAILDKLDASGVAVVSIQDLRRLSLD